MLVAASRQIDVGPIQALLDELEFNDAVARRPSTDEQGCEFRDDQFRRAIQAGSIAMLPDDVKRAVVDAYVAMGGANNTIRAAWQHPRGGNPWALSVNEAGRRIRDAQHLVTVARERLLAFLRPESDAEVRGAEPVIADRDEAQR